MTKREACATCACKKELAKLDKIYRAISRDMLLYDKKISKITEILAALVFRDEVA